MENTLLQIVLAPFITSIAIGLAGRKMPRFIVGPLACMSVFYSFLLSLYGWLGLSRLPGDMAIPAHILDWVTVGQLKLALGFHLDRLSLTMVLVITGVGFLIHVFSLGYMEHEEGYARYFGQLNLFVFFMLVLVLASGLPLLFCGWEGVGVTSYLLIGFYFTDSAKAKAGKKAFIVNRVGDFFFVLGMLLIGIAMKGDGPVTLEIHDILDAVPRLMQRPVHLDLGLLGVFNLGSVATIAALCFVMGATGKSAQIPLYVWLPDAMAGPTPVSALIHAATMVTAGVYLGCRLNPLLAVAPRAMHLLAVIGVVTLLASGAIALVQTDLKKILAYSTISQLGYMFLGVGVGAYSAALFHLVTHAFFKALLFLCAGSIIHALHGEQDIRKMGGLERKIPVTCILFRIGALALAGFPPLAGFFSKDAILVMAYRKSILLYFGGLVGAAMTAIYITRASVLVFAGESRVDRKIRKEVHEAPSVMLLPCIVLAVGACMAGFLSVPAALGGPDTFAHLMEPILGVANGGAELSTFMERILMAISALIAVGGILVTRHVYLTPTVVEVTDMLAKTTPAEALQSGLFVDALYDTLFVQPFIALCGFFRITMDEGVIDGGFVEGTARVSMVFSQGLTALQSGQVQNAMLAVVLGLAALLFVLTMPMVSP